MLGGCTAEVKLGYGITDYAVGFGDEQRLGIFFCGEGGQVEFRPYEVASGFWNIVQIVLTSYRRDWVLFFLCGGGESLLNISNTFFKTAS